MPEWITDRLPKLEYSASYDFQWRSKLVVASHCVLGRVMVNLYGTGNMEHLWWEHARNEPFPHSGHAIPLEDITGWLPLSTLPEFIHARTEPWQLHEYNQKILEVAQRREE